MRYPVENGRKSEFYEEKWVMVQKFNSIFKRQLCCLLQTAAVICTHTEIKSHMEEESNCLANIARWVHLCLF